MASPKSDGDSNALKLRPLSALLHPRKKHSSHPSSMSTEVDSPNPDSPFPQVKLPYRRRIFDQNFGCKMSPTRQVCELLLKITITFLAIPGLMAVLGYATERLIYGDGPNSTSFHRTTMVYSGLIAAPFILLRWCWKWPKHLVKLEMIFYFIHTTVMIITIMSIMIDGGTAHFVAEQIRDVFTGSPYTSITTDNDVYVYLDQLVRKIYDNKPRAHTSPMLKLPGQISLLGGIRLKQSRTKRKACFSSLRNIGVDITNMSCTPQFSKEDEDREPYGNGIMFNYTDPSFLNYAGIEIKLSDIYTTGRFGKYPVAGYWVIFPKYLWEWGAINMVASLKNASWIDEQTRQMSLDFLIVVKDLPNPIITEVILTIEKSPAGKFLPMSPAISFSYIEYISSFASRGPGNVCEEITTQTGFLRPIYLGVLPVAIYTLFSCLYQLYTSWRDFLSSIYSYVESLWILVVIGIFIFRWLSIYYTHCASIIHRQSIWRTGYVFDVEFSEVLPMAEYWHRARQMLCIALFLYMFNSLKFLTKLTRFDTIGKTLGYAFQNLASFFLSFSVIFIAFVVMFYLLFSSADDKYHSFAQSVGTVWNALLGNVDINNDLLVARETYLPLLIVFTFFLSFVLLTVVIAIVTDAYEKTKEELNERRQRSSSIESKGWQSVRRLVRYRWPSHASVLQKTRPGRAQPAMWRRRGQDSEQSRGKWSALCQRINKKTTHRSTFS